MATTEPLRPGRWSCTANWGAYDDRVLRDVFWSIDSLVSLQQKSDPAEAWIGLPAGDRSRTKSHEKKRKQHERTSARLQELRRITEVHLTLTGLALRPVTGDTPNEPD